MKRPVRTIISTKIEANKDKIYRAQDVHDLAYIIFPNKNAKDLRIAFILIFLSIKYNPKGKLTSPEIDQIRINKKTDISQKTLWKARACMARLGIIERRDGIYWTFSSRFTRSIINLGKKLSSFMVPQPNPNTEEKEWRLLYFC
jgi:hypothetical protein